MPPDTILKVRLLRQVHLPGLANVVLPQPGGPYMRTRREKVDANMGEDMTPSGDVTGHRGSPQPLPWGITWSNLPVELKVDEGQLHSLLHLLLLDVPACNVYLHHIQLLVCNRGGASVR